MRAEVGNLIAAALRDASIRQLRSVTVDSAMTNIVREMPLNRGLWLFKSEPRADLRLGTFPWKKNLPTCEWCQWRRTVTIQGVGVVNACFRNAPAPECIPLDVPMYGLDGDGDINWWTDGGTTTITSQSAAPRPGNCIRLARGAVGFAKADQPFGRSGRFHITGWFRGDGTQFPGLRVMDNSGTMLVADLASGSPSNNWNFFDVTTPYVESDFLLRLYSNMSGAGYVEFDDISIVPIYNSKAFWNQVEMDDFCGEWLRDYGDGVPWVLGDNESRNTEWFDDETGNGPRPGPPGEPLRPDAPRMMLVEKDCLVRVELPPFWTVTASLLSQVAP